MGKKLSSFNGVTTPDDNYKLPIFKSNTDNYYSLPSDFAKSQSFWKSIGTVTAFAGGGQASATSITNNITFVTVCATANDSVKAPISLNGKYFIISNVTAVSCNLYPQTGEAFTGLAANTAIPIPAYTYVEIACTTAGTWIYSYSSGMYLSDTGITAYAGGGQANATALTKEYNKITVVATNGDSVKMKSAKKGQRMVIVNADTAQSMNIYPQTGELFEGLAANDPVSLNFIASLEAFCFVDGTWTVL